MKQTLVIGASENPERYSYKAVKALRNKQHQVVALAKRTGQINDVEISTEFPAYSEDIHTVSLYVGEKHQHEYVDHLLALQPKRVIFNPGTENPGLIEKLKSAGIEPIEACTLVMLSIGNY